MGTGPPHASGEGSPWERCEIHLSLPASSSSPRGCGSRGFGEGLRAGIGLGPLCHPALAGVPEQGASPGQQSFPASVPPPVLPCETRHREQKKAGTLAWKLTRCRVSFQMEQQIGSILTRRTLPAAAPAASDPCPALHKAPEALVGQSWDREAGDASGAAAFGVFFPHLLQVRDLFGSGCAAPEHPHGMSRAGLGGAGGQELI